MSKPDKRLETLANPPPSPLRSIPLRAPLNGRVAQIRGRENVWFSIRLIGLRNVPALC